MSNTSFSSALITEREPRFHILAFEIYSYYEYYIA